MAYQFSSEELNQLQSVVDLADSQQVSWASVYEKVGSILSVAIAEGRVVSADIGVQWKNPRK